MRAEAGGRPFVELGPIVRKLSENLGGSVPEPRIEALVARLLDEDFGDARVAAYLPILLYRHALEALRADGASPDRKDPR